MWLQNKEMEKNRRQNEEKKIKMKERGQKN